MAYWSSKLGNKYIKSEIEYNEPIFKSQVDHLRKLSHNRSCADCGQQPTVWASVNIGVFLCIRCGSIHRGIGTHVSIPKGCTGTYLWGPDEIERMQSRGNEYCVEMYGGVGERPPHDASDETWTRYIRDKYEYRKFMHRPTAKQHMNTTNKENCDEKLQLKRVQDGSRDNGESITKELGAIPNKNEIDFFAQYGL